jgi:hypothetical protein
MYAIPDWLIVVEPVCEMFSGPLSAEEGMIHSFSSQTLALLLRSCNRSINQTYKNNFNYYLPLLELLLPSHLLVFFSSLLEA